MRRHIMGTGSMSMHSTSNLREMIAHIEALEEAARTVLDHIDDVLAITAEIPVQHPLNPSSKAAEHRSLHRPGRPRRIDADPELRAFVEERIDRMTFEDLAEAIAQNFPPHRRIAKSALHDWFRNARPNTHPR